MRAGLAGFWVLLAVLGFLLPWEVAKLAALGAVVIGLLFLVPASSQPVGVTRR